MTAPNANALRVAPEPLEVILPLRQRVIIATTDRTAPDFEGDADPSTFHIAARLRGEVVGCATFMDRPCDGRPAYQLRGMATAPEFQRQGVGRAVLASARELLRARGVRLLWCHARIPARGFYEGQGWSVCSDEFEIPGVGPHVVMSLPLTQEEE